MFYFVVIIYLPKLMSFLFTDFNFIVSLIYEMKRLPIVDFDYDILVLLLTIFFIFIIFFEKYEMPFEC